MKKLLNWASTKITRVFFTEAFNRMERQATE